MSHTMEEDFQHFLSYSGLRLNHPEIINELRQAYESAWTSNPKINYRKLLDEHLKELGIQKLNTIGGLYLARFADWLQNKF